MLLSGSIARPFVSGAAPAPVDPKIAPAPRAREMTIFLMTQLLCVRGEPNANFISACLTDDIGYVRGILQGDDNESYVADLSGRTVRLPRRSSDAALGPYHVDRSKLFVSERLDGAEEVDAGRIARAIEYTRFPYTSSSNDDDLIEEEGLLLRAADLIGQLGDPNYLRKANALFYEFEEIGLNKTLGYDTPADVVYKYPQFYWNNVAPQIQTAIRYLNV